MNILSIDPADKRSAYVIFDSNFKIYEKDILPNDQFLDFMRRVENIDIIALEIIVPYGMPVGKTTFDTVEIIGRISEIADYRNIPLARIARPDVSRHFKVRRRRKGSKIPTADAQIRSALVERFAARPEKNYGKGSKKDPDFFYGFKADIWQSFAAGVYCADNIKEISEKQGIIFDNT